MYLPYQSHIYFLLCLAPVLIVAKLPGSRQTIKTALDTLATYPFRNILLWGWTGCNGRLPPILRRHLQAISRRISTLITGDGAHSSGNLVSKGHKLAALKRDSKLQAVLAADVRIRHTTCTPFFNGTSLETATCANLQNKIIINMLFITMFIKKKSVFFLLPKPKWCCWTFISV